MTRRSLRRGLAAAAAGGALLAACARPEPPLPTAARHLASLLPLADRIRDEATIDFGAPGARRHLGTGWGPDETSGEATYVWGLGERSTLVIDVAEPRARRLALRGWSYAFGDDPPQEVTVSVNGGEVGRRLVSDRPSRLEFDVARGLWQTGENRIELAYGRSFRADGELARAVAWEVLRLSDGEAPASEPPEPLARAIDLAAGEALEWALELPGGSWLAWDGIEATGGARLAIEVAGESEEDEVARSLPAGGAGRLRLTADDAPHRLRRIRLRALAEDRGTAVRWLAPRLHEPRAAEPPVAEVETPPANPPPNVLVYVIDTLRADRLGCYGYPRPTSPEIDRFAAGATLLREGRAQSSWTRPAMASLLTGLLPISHRAEGAADRLPDEVVTLAERLSAAGWATAMVTTNGNVVSRFGFRQGFDDFHYLPERRRSRAVHVPSQRVNEVVFRWLAERPLDRPFFLVVHTCDPHDPYTPEAPFRQRLAAEVDDPALGNVRTLLRAGKLAGDEGARLAPAIGALYDAEIAANDASFGALLRRLEILGLENDTAVVLTSDHGEEFHEHGSWTHGRTLYEEQLRIPFVVRFPGGRGAGRELAGPADQIDLAPTVLDLAGLEIPSALPGRSLAAELAAGGRRPPRPSFAFLGHNEDHAAAVMLAQWKLIRVDRREAVLLRPPELLFALGSDPGEQRDVRQARPLRRAWLAGELAAVEAARRSSLPRQRATIDRELAQRLRALGYLR